MATETERAWAAGFFDGEGWVGRSLVTKTTKSGVYICERIESTVGQNDPEVLERFKKAVGIGTIGGPYKRKKTNHKDFWQFRVSNRKAVIQLFEALSPYLSTIKTKQFQDALEREPRFCLVCAVEIELEKNLATKYCGDKCRNKAKNRTTS